MTDEREHVLVTPLGLSPGAVTGLVQVLRRGDNGSLGNFPITRVIAVTTSESNGKVHWSRERAADYFHAALPDELLFETKAISAGELRSEDGSSRAYLLALGQVLDDLEAEGHHIHVGVTAGRSGMGALAALATNVYGADHLWHLWVDEDIEEKGHHRYLQQYLPEDITASKIFDPTIANDSRIYDLVALPFMSLRPYHPLLKQYYREYRAALDAGVAAPPVPETVSPLVQLIHASGAHALTDIFPAQLTMSHADEIVAIMIEYPTANDDRREELDDDVIQILIDNGSISREERRRLKQLMQRGGTVDQLQRIHRSGEDPAGFWATLNKNAGAVSAVADVTMIVIQVLHIIAQAKGLL